MNKLRRNYKKIFISVSSVLILFFSMQTLLYAAEVPSSHAFDFEGLLTAIVEDLKASNISIEGISEWFSENKEGIINFLREIVIWIKDNIFPTEVTTLPFEQSLITPSVSTAVLL